MIPVQQFPLVGFRRALVGGGGGGGTGGVGSVHFDRSNYEQYEYEAPTAICGLTIQADGFVNVTSNNPIEGSLYYAWLLAGVASDYDVEVTLSSGSFSAGGVGSRLSLGSNRHYRVERYSTGSKIVSATVTFRNSTTNEILITESLTMTATVAP